MLGGTCMVRLPACFFKPGECNDGSELRGCGYIGMRALSTRQIVELDLNQRQSIESPDPNGNMEAFEFMPICVAGALNFSRAIGSRDRNRKMMVILSLRSCGKFIEWNPGLTPREHLEMVQSEKMLAMQIEERNRRPPLARGTGQDRARSGKSRTVNIATMRPKGGAAPPAELQSHRAQGLACWRALAIATTITAQIILDRYRAIPPTPTAGVKPERSKRPRLPSTRLSNGLPQKFRPTKELLENAAT